MNGFVLLCGALCLTSGPASFRPEAVVLGTGGTVLPIPVGVPVSWEQVESPRGPQIRMTVGRRVIQDRTVRWLMNGRLGEMWPGLNGPHVRIRP